MPNIKVQTVFERYEKKFLLGPLQYAELSKALQTYMKADQYGLHTICSIYYDTEDYQCIRHSLDKPVYKEKLRLRSYGVPTADSTVFLELKKKLDGITYKRRMPMTLAEARRYLELGIPPENQGQTFGEIDWFVQRNQPQAKVLLSYDRVALFGREDPRFRITFDAGIRFRSRQLELSKGDYGAPLISPEQRLMEIKTWTAIPCWLTSLLSELGAYPTSFSKYGTVYRNYLLHEEEIRYAG